MFAKKNLVAAAALLAVAGVAHADVKLYGMLDLGVGSMEQAHASGASARTTQVTSGTMMTSYFGLAGSEDLGSGLKAEFAIESFIAPDTGSEVKNNAQGFWGRGSFVALSGDFGKVAIGQYDNPLFTAGYTYNPFGSSMAFSPTMRHYYGIYKPATSPAGLPATGIDTGWVNSVTYESPVFSGFQVVAQAAPKESTNSGDKNSYAIAGIYNAGPLSATLLYEKPGQANPYTAYVSNQKIWAGGASYDFGVVKAFGQYTDVKTSASSGATVDQHSKIWQLGVSVPVTEKAAVMASFGQDKYKDSPAVDAVKDEVFSLGYDYTLSKRTDVYGVFSNNRHTNLSSGQSYVVGIRHNF